MLVRKGTGIFVHIHLSDQKSYLEVLFPTLFHRDAIAYEKENSTEKVAGVILKDGYGSTADRNKDEEDSTDEVVATFSSSWKLNVILALITCWYAVSLTSWGSVESGGNSANPSVGKISMWMIAASQWLMLVLYLWTLLAPKLFPDRDFS